MFISKLKIEGFRNFKNNEIIFNDGINVIIGHNNAGKTNLLKALSLIMDNSGTSKKLDVEDFNKRVDITHLKANPPEIKITLIINESTDENLHTDDLVTVSNWITRLDSPYEAQLTYNFFLGEDSKEEYIKALETITDIDAAWRIIKRDFIRKYNYKIFGGNPTLQNQAESDNLQKFDFQFLNAIRDVERDMFTGRTTLLKDVLQFFMDYEIKKDITKTIEVQTSEIKQRQQEFERKSKPAIDDLLTRISEGQKEILDYATKTGASFNKAIPTFEGGITEFELLSALKLIIQHETGIKIPATHNGLGYNNLIYMSLLLAKMQANADGSYYGSNAKVYPLLAIEEPEAHLHPSMQYKFLKFLKENKKSKVRQIFVTSHSTHITSAVSLDEIICLHSDGENLNVAYPGKVFSNSAEDKVSKAYIERFLDATKSNMLFAKKIILVEGLAEQILLPSMARHVNKEKQLEDHHIEVTNIGGRYFEHFLKLFDSTKPNTINKQIVCITDRDPVRKQIAGTNNSFKKCYPFEYNTETTVYTYQDNSSAKIAQYSAHPNITFFSQDEKGKTLEYDIAICNPSLELILTESIANQEELKELMKSFSAEKAMNEFVLRESEENTRITTSINSGNCTWGEADKKKAIIASRYLNSVGKGENALELSVKLEEDLNSQTPTFVVPQYLKDAIECLFQ